MVSRSIPFVLRLPQFPSPANRGPGGMPGQTSLKKSLSGDGSHTISTSDLFVSDIHQHEH